MFRSCAHVHVHAACGRVAIEAASPSDSCFFFFPAQLHPAGFSFLFPLPKENAPRCQRRRRRKNTLMGRSNFLSGCQRGGASQFSNTCDRDRFNFFFFRPAPRGDSLVHRRCVCLFIYLFFSLSPVVWRHAGDKTPGSEFSQIPVTAKQELFFHRQPWLLGCRWLAQNKEASLCVFLKLKLQSNRTL